MQDSIYNVSLDIHSTSSQAMLSVKKQDTGRQFNFTLTDGGKPYTISSGCTATFRAKKPDGTILYNNCTISGNVISYHLTSQTSASVGVVECEVTLYGSDSHQITSPRFGMIVEDTLYSDSEVESEDEFTQLTTAIANCNNLNASVSKVGNTATITITKKNGTTQTATVSDGTDGVDGEDGRDGVDGVDGVGISNIAKTSTVGKVDTYTITLTNGTTRTFTVTNGNDGQDGSDGEDGADGISVTGASINSSGHLVITLSNGTSVDAGTAKGSDGQDGDDGVSVTGVTINSSGHLIVTLSSGSTIDAGMAKGEKGDTGNCGVYVGTTPPTDPEIKVWIDTSGSAGDVEMTSNKVTSISSSSTNTQYPSAKCVYDTVNSIEKIGAYDSYVEVVNGDYVEIHSNNDYAYITGGNGLDMSSSHIVHVANPVYAQDAATKNYVDTAIANKTIMESGDSYVEVSESNNKVIIHSNDDAVLFDGGQGIDLDNGKIFNLGNPISNQDGATKYYVDNHHDSTKADASTTYTKTEVDSALSGKASASALTSHTSDTTIHVTSSDKSTWNGKQDAISDLATIRSNASSGASKVSCTDATVGGFGYTKNSGTVTSVAVKMNGSTKGTVTTSGTIDLGTVITAHQDISGKENSSNKVTSISSSSTDAQYPSAKCVYDLLGNVESLLSSI